MFLRLMAQPWSHEANIKINFVSPYPTVSKRERKVGRWNIFFLKEVKIPKYEQDIKTNWISLKCF